MGVVLIASSILGWTLLALALIDWRTYLLPDPLVGFLLATGFVAALFIVPEHVLDHLIGAAAGFVVFAGLGHMYRRMRGRDGLGLGDAKLLAGLGAWVSWDGLASTVLFAAGLSLLTLFARMLVGARFTLTDRLPFGTFLAAAGWLVWLYGPLEFR